MKRLLCLLAVVALVTSCSKIIPSQEVTVHFIEPDVIVTFTNGTRTYTFTEDNHTQLLPIGRYQICAEWDGGCGGMSMINDTPTGNEPVLVILPAGGTECVDNQKLGTEYYVSVNCE